MRPRKVFNRDGSYRWLIDYYDPAGKRIKRRFKKLSEAEDVISRVRVAKIEGNYGEIFAKKEAYLFRELARDYLKTCQGQKSCTDKEQIVSVLVQAFGDTDLKDCSYQSCELFRSKREATPTWSGKKRSPARVNRELAILRHMFNKAVTWGKLAVNPFRQGDPLMLKENNERIRYLTREEFARLYQAASPHLRPIIETAVNTGMRKGEILSLKWSQIRDGWIYLEETKSGKGRPVPVNDAQHEVFREILGKKNLGNPLVFSDYAGRPFGNVQKSFDAACRRAGIYDFRFHDLRHTCASWLVMSGVDLVAVQKILGHSSIKTTMRYAHLAPGHMVKAMNQIGTREVEDGRQREVL